MEKIEGLLSDKTFARAFHILTVMMTITAKNFKDFRRLIMLPFFLLLGLRVPEVVSRPNESERVQLWKEGRKGSHALAGIMLACREQFLY